LRQVVATTVAGYTPDRQIKIRLNKFYKPLGRSSDARQT